MANIDTHDPFPSFHPLRTSVPKAEAMHILNIGKTKLHGLLGEGKLVGVKNGPRTDITVKSIQEVLDSRPRVTFKPPPPPRMENLDKLHAKQRQRAEQRRAKRAQLRRFKARGG
jgi:hypothetical protein